MIASATHCLRGLGWLCLLVPAVGSALEQREDAAGRTGQLPGAPYFSFERRLALIEGSYSIIPAEPIALGNTRQLLMDNRVVDSTWNLLRKVHHPEKYPGNPLVPGGEKLLKTNWGSVMFDEALGRLRFWTGLWDDGRPEQDMAYVNVYWESTDGIRWTAPELGIVERDGSRANNVIQGEKGFNYGTGCSVIKVPPRLGHKGKYAMLYGRNRHSLLPGQTHGSEERIAWSPDGLRWADQPENPVFRGRDDTFVNMIYNPERDVFMAYRRATVNSHEIRRFAYSESRDLVSWTQPLVILDADELDAPFLYDFSVVRYQGTYLGFLHMFYAANAGYGTGPRLYKDGRVEKKEEKIDVQLAWSRDGIRWERHPERPIFLETGLGGPGSYDWGQVFVCQGLIEKDGKIHLYYRGDNILHRDPIGSGKSANFCLATLRRDGFVSRGTPDIGNHPGYLLTRPLLCPGGRLHINGRTAPGGAIRVAVRRGDGVRDGDWLPGWNFEEGPAFTGDSTDTVLEWKGRENFDALLPTASGAPSGIRLHFWLDRAELYSFWFE